MKKLFLLFILGVAYSVSSIAQVSEGGTPPSFKYSSSLKSAKQPYAVSVNIDRSALLAEDAVAKRFGEPLRVATVIPQAIDLVGSGEWTTLPNKQRILRQTINVSGANSLILSYKDFYIPEGGKLFIYNKNKSEVLGAFTERNNPQGGVFSTQMIYGDEITLEYVESTISTETPRIVIEDIGYVYKPILEESFNVETGLRAVSPGGADFCLIDVNCAEGDAWQNQKRGAVHITMKFPNGWYVCSGSLINNTKNDGTPFLLTANHCFFDEDQNTQANFKTAQFYFNYEKSTCSGSTIVATKQSVIGSELLVDTKIETSSDGVLLKLTTDIPAEYKPYFNGWNVGEEAPTSGVVIHHPAGDVKKITTYNTTPTTVAFDSGVKAFWEVKYSSSITEGGSSGSPIFNQDGLIIGTLTGGESYCTNGWHAEDGQYGGPGYPDYYGKLNYHWNKDKDSKQWMQTYLDPTTSGVKTLQGYDPYSTGVKSELESSKVVNLVVFPNPVAEELNVNANGIISSIAVYNLLGYKVYSAEGIQSSTIAIPVQTWDKGVYSVVVATENGKFTEKITKK